MMYLPQCMNCTRFQYFKPGRVGVCTAFPDGIPSGILSNETDHRRAVDGDHGVRWAAIDPTVPHPLALVEEGAT